MKKIIMLSLLPFTSPDCRAEVIRSRWHGDPITTTTIGELTLRAQQSRAQRRAVCPTTIQPTCKNPWSGQLINPVSRLLPQIALEDSSPDFELRAAKHPKDKESLAVPPGITPGISFAVGLQQEFQLETKTSFSMPPDAVGVAGETQFVTCLNGSVRSFNKKTGGYQRGLSFDLPAPEQLSSARMQYDRGSQKFFILAKTETSRSGVDASQEGAGGLFLFVLDSKVLTPATKVICYAIPAMENSFFDAPSLGIDEHAIYIGANTGFYDPNDTLSNRSIILSEVFVANKRNLIQHDRLTVTRFSIPIDKGNKTGIWAPQAVTNFDKDPQHGYFVATDAFSLGLLHLLEISNPAESPELHDRTISIPLHAKPVAVPHKNNTHGAAGYLDSLDERLSSAHIRGGSLWTSHCIGIDAQGISSPMTTPLRNGCRWYEINLASQAPTPLQYGTLCASDTSKDAKALPSYSASALMTNGQGTMIIGARRSGAKQYIDAAWSGRFADQPYGSLLQTQRSTKNEQSYNPELSSTERAFGTRFLGETSQVSVDPLDDMTLWVVQTSSNVKNQWQIQAQQLKMPAPPSIVTTIPSKIQPGQDAAHVTLLLARNQPTRASAFDPGAQFTTRLSASATGGVNVLNAYYVSPTEVELELSTQGVKPGTYDLTITNPDGTETTTHRILNIAF